jgi:hypothetical protein
MLDFLYHLSWTISGLVALSLVYAITFDSYEPLDGYNHPQLGEDWVDITDNSPAPLDGDPNTNTNLLIIYDSSSDTYVIGYYSNGEFDWIGWDNFKTPTKWKYLKL